MVHWTLRWLAQKSTVERVGWFATGLSAAGVGLVAYQVVLGSGLASAAGPAPRQSLSATSAATLASPMPVDLNQSDQSGFRLPPAFQLDLPSGPYVATAR